MKRLFIIGLCKECRQIEYVSFTSLDVHNASDDVKLSIGNSVCEIMGNGLTVKAFEYDGNIVVGSHLPDCSEYFNR